MLTVACVLKKPETQLKYDASWVHKLQRGVLRNLKIPHRFVCLSDMDIPNIEVIPLKHNWMMYWSKIELFRPDLFDGQVLYIDIDTMITNNIDEIVSDCQGMTMLTDFYSSFKNSGLMFWDGKDKKYYEIYNRMVKNPTSIMVKHRYKAASTGNFNYGDQEYIANTLENLNIPVREWQKIYPKEYFMPFSFEGHANLSINNPHPNLKICYCLGSPKFDDYMKIPLVANNWI